MKSNIFKRGFIALILTQFFGAANDNILKGVLIFMIIDGKMSLGDLFAFISFLAFLIAPFVQMGNIGSQIYGKTKGVIQFKNDISRKYFLALVVINLSF